MSDTSKLLGVKILEAVTRGLQMLKLKISSPWGTVEINGYLDNIKYCRQQTQYSITNGTVKDKELALDDIKAYDIILGLNSELTARVFTREKELMKKQGNRYKNSMSVILRMQAKSIISLDA